MTKLTTIGTDDTLYGCALYLTNLFVRKCLSHG